MATQEIDAIAGVCLPDTGLVREATDFIRDAGDDLLFNHSRRVFFFGALQGMRRGLQPNLELLYVGAMFHDLGLTERYRTSTVRFEVDGANAAREFLLELASIKPTRTRYGSASLCTRLPGCPSSSIPRSPWSQLASKPTCWASAATTWIRKTLPR
jgi:hypothetical protein